MIILLALTHCLAQTINRTLYLVEGELYKQSLPELFSDTTDKQYSFLDEQSKGFQIDQSNLKQLPLVGKYALDPTTIISQKQYKNINDYQGNGQYGILQEYETDKYQICYNFDISKLDMDYCIQLDETHTGFDFTFLSFGNIAVSSRSGSQYIITTYEGTTQKTQYAFAPTVFNQNVKSTKIDQMIFNGDKYLLVVGIYPTTQINVPIDVLKINQDGTITKTSLYINLIDIVQQQGLYNVLDVKGYSNGTVYVQVSNITDKLTYQIVIIKDTWRMLYQFEQQKNIGFDLGYSNLEGNSYGSFIFVTETYFRLQSMGFAYYIERQYQQVVSSSATFKFTQNYLILLQDNKLIINNFQNNIQKIHDLKLEILSIDGDFLNDILIVFAKTEIRKYQLQDIYLTYQDLKTDALDTIIIKNGGGQMAIIKYRVLDKKDYNLYQISSPLKDIYYNFMYQSNAYKIPQFVSGFNPELKVTTDKQLLVDSSRYKLQDISQDLEVPLQSQLIMSDGLTGIFKQYKNFSFSIYPCRQYSNLQCLEQKIPLNEKYTTKVKLFTLQQGTDLGYLILVNDKLDVYRKDYQTSTIQDVQIINDVVVTDRIFVVYQGYAKVYTLSYGAEISKIDTQNTGINDPIRIWANTLFNNYIFILSQTGQLVIGQFTNQFYKTESIKLDTTNVDISIISKDKVVISQKVNNNFDVSLYLIVDGKLVKQYELDLHGYTVTDYVLQKDFQNGKVGVLAQLNNQQALLLYGNTQLQRDQLQQIISLGNDFSSLSLLGNQDQTHILISQKSKTTQSMVYAYYDYQYMNIAVVPQYQTSEFSQLLPVTYECSNSFNKISISKSIAYEYNFYIIKGKEIKDIEYKSNDNQVVTELPSELFSGQVNSMTTTGSPYVKLSTRIKNASQVKGFGLNYKCQQISKFERVICVGQLSLTYHKYNGELVQKLDSIPITTKLLINKDQTSALVISFLDASLIKITQNQLTLFPGTAKLPKNLNDEILFYKNWIVYNDFQLEFYLVKAETQLTIELQNIIDVSLLSKFDYHPGSQSLYYTQFTVSKLSQIKVSLETDTLTIGKTTQFDVQDYLNKNKIYVYDLALSYLQVFDSTIMISSTYGHLYTFNLDDFKLINLYILTGPSSYIYDIKIQDQYVVVKGSLYTNLFKNTGDWSVNKPYLSLEALPFFNTDCIALYKQNDVVNIMYVDQTFNIVNAIIDDRILLEMSNLQQTVPSKTLFISASNGYSLKVTYFGTEKIDVQGDSSDNKWIIILAIVGTVVIVGIGWYIYKKKQQKTHDTLL